MRHDGTAAGSRVKVVYVAGSGRSGSTVLANILGQHEGFFAVGELRYVWERGVLENCVCGCQRRFRDCPVWSQVVRRLLGDPGEAALRSLIRARDRALPPSRLPVAASPWGRPLLRRRAHGYLDVLARLYRTIVEVSGCRVLVDSSKSPTYGYLLQLVPGVDLHVVHLVRDARAVAYSMRRPRVELATTAPALSAYHWDASNALAEALLRRARYRSVRYDDFVARPQATVAAILGTLGEAPPGPSPFVGERAVALRPTHCIGGNPSRFVTGRVELRPDDEWRTRMRRVDRGVVELVCWPLLARYGYLRRDRAAR